DAPPAEALRARTFDPSRVQRACAWRSEVACRPRGVTKGKDMKPICKAMGMTAALALGLTVLAGLTLAQDARTPPSPADLLKALADAGKPGPEHRKLEPFVGDWTFTLKLWTDPGQPPAELKGTVERKWIMGGRFIQETAKGECAKTGKTFEGMG